MKKISTRKKAFLGLLAAAGLMAATPFSAYADSGLDMSTEYPGISVKAGEVLDFGGLLGYGPIMPVNSHDPSVFINRGGRLPAPMQSLKN